MGLLARVRVAGPRDAWGDHALGWLDRWAEVAGVVDSTEAGRLDLDILRCCSSAVRAQSVTSPQMDYDFKAWVTDRAPVWHFG